MARSDVDIWQTLRANWRAVVFAVALHVVVVVLLVVGVNFRSIVPAGGSNPEHVVDAVVINSNALPAPPASKPEPVAPQTKLEPDPKEDLAPDIEQQRQAEAERQKAAAEAKKQAELKAQEQAAKKKAQQQAKLKAEKKAQAAAEEQAKRKAEEAAKQKAAAEAKAQAKARKEAEAKAQEAAKRKAAAEEKAKAEAQKQAEEEAKKRAQAERKAADEARRKTALQQVLDAEARSREDAALADDRSRYAQLIRSHVEANWLRPPGAGSVRCKVRVDQLPNGGISRVELLSSCGSEALDRSVEKAIYKSDPLPLPANRNVFQRELIFTFEPQQ